jgi:hypothetical protein
MIVRNDYFLFPNKEKELVMQSYDRTSLINESSSVGCGWAVAIFLLIAIPVTAGLGEFAQGTYLPTAFLAGIVFFIARAISQNRTLRRERSSQRSQKEIQINDVQKDQTSGLWIAYCGDGVLLGISDQGYAAWLSAGKPHSAVWVAEEEEWN